MCTESVPEGSLTGRPRKVSNHLARGLRPDPSQQGVQTMTTSVQTPTADEFYRQFAARIRETVAPEHTRAADETPAVLRSAVEVARRWTLRTVNGVTVDGYLPAWPDENPSQENIPADRLQLALADLCLRKN